MAIVFSKFNFIHLFINFFLFQLSIGSLDGFFAGQKRLEFLMKDVMTILEFATVSIPHLYLNHRIDCS